MKMFLKIIRYRFLLSIKHPVVLACLLSALCFSILVGVNAHYNEQNSSMYPIAIVDENNGEFASDFIKQIEESDEVDVQLMDRDRAIRQVSTGQIDGAFVLLKGFSEKIESGDYVDLVEFISPSVTTSAYPVSEIVSSEVMDLWLDQLVQNRLSELYDELGDEAVVDYDEIISKIDTDYISDDIISISFMGDEKIIEPSKAVDPIDIAIGVYAAFVIFAIMLSGEWIFNIKQKGLQSRFISCNTNIYLVCLGSQVASVLLAMLFFIPLMIVLSIYLSLKISVVLYIALGMFLFLLSICSMAFVVSAFSENLIQMIVLGASISIINILISALVTPMPEWSALMSKASRIFPGTYLIECYSNPNQLLVLAIITFIWIAFGYLSILLMRRKFAGKL